MSILVAKTEIDVILSEMGVLKYYMEIDMNGGMTLVLAPEFEDKQQEIQTSLAERDKSRTPDDIYDVGEMLYPLKRVVVGDDDDEAEELFAKRELVRAHYSQQLNTWLKPREGDKDKERPPRVVFYSYKGGVGRSTALAIVARILAKQGFTVAVVDLDLEAPGLNSLLLTRPKPSPFGVVDYLYHAPWIRNTMTRERFLSQYVVREEVRRRNEKPGQIFVMSAGGTVVRPMGSNVNLLFDEDEVEVMLEPNYLQKLSYIDFDVYARQSTHVFEHLLDDLAKYTGAQVILLDARTGISNVSGALIKQFSDVLSVHIQDNRQNREGIEFITNYIGTEKLGNTIWSHTKVPRHYPRAVEELQGFIWSEVEKKVGETSERVDLNFHHLSFDSDLENINAQQLKKYMDTDRFLEYRELTEKIVGMAGVEKGRQVRISDEDRLRVVNELGRLATDNQKVTYISQRFLNEDFELFVGFPESGKKTFAEYMLKQYGKKVDVVGFDKLQGMKYRTHRILTKAVFLEWTYEEATQAVCKLLLQSGEFCEWVIRNKFVEDSADPASLEEMRRSPEYELPQGVAETLVESVFGVGNEGRGGVRGWKYIFFSMQYRAGYVLPKDIVLAVDLYINYFVEHLDKILKDESSQSFFPFLHNVESSLIWKAIGEYKKKWLLEYDKRLVDLVLHCKKQYGFANITTIDRAMFQELFRLELGISQAEVEEIVKKAIRLDILYEPRYEKDNPMLLYMMAPVYQLIKKD